MTPGRSVACVTDDDAVATRIRDALLHRGADGTVDRRPAAAASDIGATHDVVVVTDVGANPRTALADVTAAAPARPVLVAARNGGEELASDVLAAGAAAYVPLDDRDRLAARLGDLVDADTPASRFFDRVVEHVGVGVGAYRRDGRITYANPAYAALLDRDAGEMQDRYVWDLNPSVDEARFTEYFDSFDPGETRHSETVHRRADGSVIPVHTVTTRVTVAGTPLHVGTILDISDRVATERKIEALHDVATALADCDTRAAVYDLVVDAADRILDLHACYVVERADDAFSLGAASDAAPELDGSIPDDHGVLWETYRRGEPVLVEDVDADDRARPAHRDFASAVSVPVGDHGVFQAIAIEAGAFDEDDLELAALLATHAAAALDRVRFESELRAERDRFAALFDNVPNAVVAFELRDGDVVATDVNPEFRTVFGYEGDEFVGQNIDDTLVPASADAKAEAAALTADIAAGRSVTTEVQRLAADGTRDFLLNLVPITDGEASGAGYAIYTDITDQKQRERQLARQNDRLEEFASVVSHDLRNPLNVAAGRIDLAAASATDETATHLARAQDALDRIDALVADVLSLAREGKTVGETTRVALADVARTAWASVDTGAATLTVADPPVVHADRSRVCQLLENLFRNSVEHGTATAGGNGGDDGGSDAAVTVTVGGLPDGFFVADDGPGIPPGDRERVFTSGYTTGEDGTGLGLSIVERIAGAHGWTVSVTDSAAGGARFEVTDVDLAPAE